MSAIDVANRPVLAPGAGACSHATRSPVTLDVGSTPAFAVPVMRSPSTATSKCRSMRNGFVIVWDHVNRSPSRTGSTNATASASCVATPRMTPFASEISKTTDCLPMGVAIVTSYVPSIVTTPILSFVTRSESRGQGECCVQVRVGQIRSCCRFKVRRDQARRHATRSPDARMRTAFPPHARCAARVRAQGDTGRGRGRTSPRQR